MCFELRQLESADEDTVDLIQHVKVCLVELQTLVPYQHVLEKAVHMTVSEVIGSKGLSEDGEGTQPPLLPEEVVALTCRSATERGRVLQDVLSRRGVQLAWGEDSDEPGVQSVTALDRLRDARTLELLAAQETVLETVQTTLDFLRRLQSKGVQLGLVSAFPYVTKVLERVKVAYMFQSVVTERDMWELRHRPGPYPDALLRSCADLGAGMGEAIVLEASGEGVIAAREGNFGLLIAVCTPDQPRPMSADMVTYNANEISLTTIVEWFVNGVQKDSWNLQYNAYNPGLELQRETLTTVGNGYMSSRGCFELYGEQYTESGAAIPSPGGAKQHGSQQRVLEHYPGHYINGVYSRTVSTVADGAGGKTVENTDLVNCPDWTYLRVAIGEEEIAAGCFIDPLNEEVLHYAHQLDIKGATLQRSLTYRDKKGRISRIDSQRLVSMDLMHIASLSFSIQPLNYSELVKIRSGIDGSVKNTLVQRYHGLNSQHLKTVSYGSAPEASGHSSFYLLSKVEVPETYIVTAVKNVVSVLCQGEDAVDVLLQPDQVVGVGDNPDLVFEDFTAYVDGDVEATLRVDKVVSVFTSRDTDSNLKDGSIASCLARGSSRDLGASFNTSARSSVAGQHWPSPRSNCQPPATTLLSGELLSSDDESVATPKVKPSLATLPCAIQALVASSFTLLADITSFHRVFDPHRQAWQDIWDVSDIQIEGDRASQRVARLHVYHLNVTASAHLCSIDAGFLARGLHGEGYRGHVFWDELHAFPFFLSTQPNVCKAHLQYRLNRLRVAQNCAKNAGYRGAMYPWQTADTGHEVTQKVHFNPYDKRWHDDFSHRQRHVNIAIFYDAHLYLHRTTSDGTAADVAWRDSLIHMMLEIALFWSSLCTYHEAGQKYHTEGVMGPDEFHEGHVLNEDGSVDKSRQPVGVSDNAYTNVMCVWLLERALELIRVNEARDSAPVCDDDDEDSEETRRPRVRVNPLLLSEHYPVKLWADITKRMYVPMRGDGVIEQFAGFLGLKELEMSKYKHRVKDIGRMDLLMQAEDKEAGQFQLLKQADTLLLWHLLDAEEVFAILTQLGYGERHTAQSLLRTNYDFYVPRTMDGSSLSLLVHAHLASELFESGSVWPMFTEASRTDIHNRNGTTREGIHCSVMSSSLSFIHSRFAGIREIWQPMSSALRYSITPDLPSHWESVSLRKKIRAYDYYLTITPTNVSIRMESDLVSGEEPVTFVVMSKGKDGTISSKTVVTPAPWSPVDVTTNPLCKIKDFYDLMHQTWHHRKVMCYNYFMGGILWDRRQFETLNHVHKMLSDLPKIEAGGFKARLLLSGRTHIDCDLTYEITELAKDLMMLSRGESEMVEKLVRQKLVGFDAHIEGGLAFLSQNKERFRTWITDRDGTTNNYCGRYNSSVQSIHNSIWITRFALCCGRAVCITSAPLANPGIVNVSVNYEPAFVYAGSKGKEYIDGTGTRRSFPITEAEQTQMQLLNKKLSELCRRAEYTKFTLVGSGLQLKFAQTTVARQDICGSIKRKDSEAFLERVTQLCEEVAPGGFEVIDTQLDIEIMPIKRPAPAGDDATAAPAEERGFDKGDGLHWLGEELAQDLSLGPNLITGDTSGDLPMVRESMRQCPDKTYAIFVTEDQGLMKKVWPNFHKMWWKKTKKNDTGS